MIIPNDKVIYYFMLILSNLNPYRFSRLNDYPVSYKSNYAICIDDEIKKQIKDNENFHIAVTDIERKNLYLHIAFPIELRFSDSNHQQIKKIFLFLLYEINRQAYSNKNFFTDTVSFHINELIDNGLYKDIRTARTALKKVLNFFTITYFSYNQGLFNFIQKYEIKNSICTFKFFDIYSWFNYQSYIDIPNEMFSLSNRSFTLLWYLLYIARVNCYFDNPKKKESVNVSLEAIQRLLSLPVVQHNKFVKKTVIQPIQKAIQEINSINQNILDIDYVEDTRSPYYFFKNTKLNVKYKDDYKGIENNSSENEIIE